MMRKVETVDLPPSDPGQPTTIPLVGDRRVRPRVTGGSTVFVDLEDGVSWSGVIGPSTACVGSSVIPRRRPHPRLKP